ncbi:MAG: hypothetical protein KDA21_02665, partial [Phycisphaerales bacterium]|nr:hypothetical protein [Phycisphaerales bacterium]
MMLRLLTVLICASVTLGQASIQALPGTQTVTKTPRVPRDAITEELLAAAADLELPEGAELTCYRWDDWGGDARSSISWALRVPRLTARMDECFAQAGIDADAHPRRPDAVSAWMTWFNSELLDRTGRLMHSHDPRFNSTNEMTLDVYIPETRRLS